MVDIIDFKDIETPKNKEDILYEFFKKYPEADPGPNIIPQEKGKWGKIQDKERFKDLWQKQYYETLPFHHVITDGKLDSKKIQQFANQKSKAEDMRDKLLEVPEEERGKEWKNSMDSVNGALMKITKLTMGGRGGTEETQAEMKELDTRPPEYVPPTDPDEYLGGMYPDEVIDEEKELTLKERLAELWADGSKRDAILGSISETLLETRYGKEAYGSRWRDLPKNVRAELQEAEALNIIKDQATLDMMKTKAETEAAANPMQYLSNTQKNARDHATAIGVKEGFVFGSKEWHTAYATALENMAMENLLTGPVEGIAAINELLVRNTGLFDEATMKVFKDVIAQLTSRITTDGGVKSTSAKDKIYGGGTEPGE